MFQYSVSNVSDYCNSFITRNEKLFFNYHYRHKRHLSSMTGIRKWQLRVSLKTLRTQKPPPRSYGSLCFQSWKTETRKQWKRKDDSGGGGWRWRRMEVMITVFCSSLYCLLCQCVSLNSQASKV